VKFAIRIDWFWRPFMLFIGATHANSYVELRETELHLRFGPAFDHTISRDNVIRAAPMAWGLINGLGVRAGGEVVGLIGSTSGVVELQLRQPVVLRFAGWPWTVSRVAVSLERPDEFIEQVTRPERIDH
jgi:hypothetical protein